VTASVHSRVSSARPRVARRRQALFSWAEDDDAALESAKEWKATLPPEHYTDPIHKPGEIPANGRDVRDTKFKAAAVISADPKDHVRKIKLIGEMGATAIVMMNTSGADPEGALRTYGEHVLPAPRI
jgi:coenzyme F420-dependent glucose-6-phosphate dehydrogenase